MTPNRPTGRPRPFGPDELAGVAGLEPAELAADARLARDLEAIADRGRASAPADFTDRVMAAIAGEPQPAPMVAAGSALRRGALLGVLASVRDSFRVAFGGGFPMAVRAQALALVLLAAGVATGSGLVTAGALGVFDAPRSPSPEPSVVAPTPVPTQSPATPVPTDTPSATFEIPSPSPDGSLEPATSGEPEDTAKPDGTNEPGGTNEPDETEEPDDHGGGGGEDSGSGDGGSSTTPSPSPRDTPRPTEEPEETSTPEPTETPDDD